MSRRSEIFWSRDKVFNLIEILKDQPCLWDSHNEDYTKSERRENALRRIAEYLNIASTTEIRKKLHTLRSQFIKERHKIQAAKIACDQDYQVKWEFYEHMKFMFKSSSYTTSKNQIKHFTTKKTSKLWWNHQRVFKLLKLVQNHPCLWDVKHKDYPNREMRAQILETISDALNASSTELIRKKLHTLRSQFLKEKHKICSSKSENEANENYTTKWIFYDAMKFMFCSSDEDGENYDDTVEMLDFNEQDFGSENQINKSNLMTVDTASISVDQQSRPTSSTSLKTYNESESLEEETSTKWTDPLQAFDKRDICGIFGEYVASELRSLTHFPDLQHKMKTLIQHVIIDVGSEKVARLIPQHNIQYQEQYEKLLKKLNN